MDVESRHINAAIVAAATFLLAVGCSGEQGRSDSGQAFERAEGETAEREVIYTVNYPLAYFAERIGGDWVRVELPVPAGTDPAYWSPPPEEIAAYQGADLILLNGAGYASWVPRASLPEWKLVNTSAAVQGELIVADEAMVHSHGPEGEHEHENTAFTTWLDPTIAIEQASVIRDALIRLQPAHEADFDAGFRELEGNLVELDRRFERWAADWSGRPILASHPVYQYLARRYELDLRSVHFEPNVPPAADQWRSLRALTGEHPAEWMLWESEPLPEIRTRLKEDFGISTVVFDPVASRPATGDYLSVMRANAERLEAMSTVQE